MSEQMSAGFDEDPVPVVDGDEDRAARPDRPEPVGSARMSVERDALSPETSADMAGVPWRAVAVFVAVSFALAWIVALPLWLRDPQQPGYAAIFTPIASAMMFTPLVATLVVVFAMRVPRRERLRFLGFWPLRPARRVVWFIVASWLAPIVLVVACLAISAAFGWVRLDLAHLSGFAQLIDAQLSQLPPDQAELAAAAMPSPWLLVVLQLLLIPLGALFNSIFALGEELGWRGWLLPVLRPLGVWPALLLSGAIWGLWHSPLILLGYNFGRTDWTGVVLMTVGCVAWGVLFGWTRLRTGSVWPAVIGHGSLNASAGLFALLAAADSPADMALINPLGVPGWIVIAVVVLILVAIGQFKRESQLAVRSR